VFFCFESAKHYNENVGKCSSIARAWLDLARPIGTMNKRRQSRIKYFIYIGCYWYNVGLETGFKNDVKTFMNR